VLWVLIDDGEEGIHRVREGNYLGRNHGKIVEISESYVSVIEIVSTGVEGWIERPRTLKLSETN
jgi:type IV pilus assembly protein PilP